MEVIYASQLKMSIIQLHIQLQQTKKGSMNAVDYCIKIKWIADKMLAAGGHIWESEFVVYVLGRLGEEYEILSLNLTTRLQIPSLR